MKFTHIIGIHYRQEEKDDYARQRCLLDIYAPEDRAACKPVIVWFYGGGLTSGDRHVPPALMEQGIMVVTPDYRLSPIVKAPAYIDDAAAAVAWTLRNCEQYGGDPERVIVAGASAGAFLAALITLDVRWLSAYGMDAGDITGLCCMTGQMITHFTIRAERGLPDHRSVIDELAPLHHVRADAPPVLLTTGDRDLELPGRWEENALFHKMMKHVGHPDIELHELKGADHAAVEGMSHPLLLSFLRRVAR